METWPIFPVKQGALGAICSRCPGTPSRPPRGATILPAPQVVALPLRAPPPIGLRCLSALSAASLAVLRHQEIAFQPCAPATLPKLYDGIGVDLLGTQGHLKMLGQRPARLAQQVRIIPQENPRLFPFMVIPIAHEKGQPCALLALLLCLSKRVRKEREVLGAVESADTALGIVLVLLIKVGRVPKDQVRRLETVRPAIEGQVMMQDITPGEWLMS